MNHLKACDHLLLLRLLVRRIQCGCHEELILPSPAWKETGDLVDATGASLSMTSTVFFASNVTCDAKFRLLNMQAHARITVHITCYRLKHDISDNMDQLLNTKQDVKCSFEFSIDIT